MCKFWSLVYLLLLCSAALAAAQGSTNKTSLWQTLDGNAPLVIARGGFSGLFPDSSFPAYNLALLTSSPQVILWCDVQLTKDGAGICFPDLRLENASDIEAGFKDRSKTYSVNGVPMQGLFSVDFALKDLSMVSLIQGIYSRTDKFDGNPFQILTVQDVAKQFSPSGFWLNIQHDAFFSQHNLSMRSFILSVTRSIIVNYISSPEVNFLKGILARKPTTTKLVFRFLGQDEIEPSTNQTYGSLLKNLTFVKTFASGILVPKSYIWPVDKRLYLQPYKSVVLDAHKEGLEVFASEFSNDAVIAYDYGYDPVAEYLSFIDNGIFSVDGVLSDFPLTPSAAIDCFSHIGKNVSGEAYPLVISYKGASGFYPGCTDLAYKKAISDGVDVLDCPVQMTKDGIPICLGSINLIDSTTAAQSRFSSLTMNISELMAGTGIFTFSLTWSQIQRLTAAISNPYKQYNLYRNPNSTFAGNFMSLSEFLALTRNTSSVSRVLISIENAAYLAAKQGLSVTDAVLDALSEAGYNNQTAKKVMIQSAHSSVLIKIKEKNNYELVYQVDETIRDALNSSILDIKKFANSVAIKKSSVFPESASFLTGLTNVVSKLQAFKLPVYVQLFSNEFISQPWDFLTDAYVEINSYVMGPGIDGIITDFPGTAVNYRRNKCLGSGSDTPPYMSPVLPGSLMELVTLQNLPLAEAPAPVLTDSDVVEPPLPSAAEKSPTSNTGAGPSASAPTPPNGRLPVGAIVGIVTAASVVLVLILLVLRVKGYLGGKDLEDKELRGLDMQTGYFTLRQIKAATSNFNSANKIGEGGFGSVYKGVLSNGIVIAVKQLSPKSKQGNREFVNEIGMISAVQHPNLVRLYGCCIEGNQLLLIYEYMENNNLGRALFGPEEHRLNLDWPTRKKICLGIARGLAYLHEESRLKIVHRDIKAANVLLDKDLNAKISDFGLAKLDEEENTHMSTKIAGTIGYMAPEYAIGGYLTDKADVYSFGVVLLETVSGKSITNNRRKEEFVHLVEWACILKEQGNLLELVDPGLDSNYSKEEAMRILNLSILCTNQSAAFRPSMSSAVSMLEGNSPVQAPLLKLSSVSTELRFKAFEELSQDSQTHASTSSQDGQVRRSKSMDEPLIDSSISIQSNKNESVEKTSSSKLFSDLYNVNVD